MKNLKLTALICVLITAYSAKAQNQLLIKRITQGLAQSAPADLGEAYFTLAYHYSLFKTDSATKYINLSEEWAKENNNLELQLMTQLVLGKVVRNRVNLDSGGAILLGVYHEARQKNLSRPLGFASIELAKYYSRVAKSKANDTLLFIGLEAFRELGDSAGVVQVFAELGGYYAMSGQSNKSYELSLKAKDLAVTLQDSFLLCHVYKLMSQSLYITNNEEAIVKSKKGIHIAHKIGNVDALRSFYESIGVFFAYGNQLDSAEKYFRLTIEITEENNFHGLGDAYGNLGYMLVLTKGPEYGLDYFYKALQLSESESSIRVCLSNLGECYGLMGVHDSAQFYFDTAYALYQVPPHSYWQEEELLRAIIDWNKSKGDFEKALEWEDRRRVVRDSVQSQANAESQKAIAKQREEEKAKALAEIAKHKAEKEERIKTLSFVGAIVLLVLISGGLYSRFRYIRKSKATLQTEKDRSDNLLLNILPQEIAEELKNTGASEARDFDQVTVLFSDFKEFTQTAKKLSAKELVGEINTCFKAFDDIMHRYKIEKIKTIGDAYMAAGGLHEPKTSEPEDVVKAGIEMQEFIINRKIEQSANGLPAFDMRVGIHTGPVVAGIVGIKKFQYDIWGDTVNTAARMESHGEIAKVNISNSTYEILKDNTDFAFKSRGKSEVKGLGETEMWYVTLS